MPGLRQPHRQPCEHPPEDGLVYEVDDAVAAHGPEPPAVAIWQLLRRVTASPLFPTADIVKTKEPRPLKISIVAPALDDWIRRWRAGAAPWEPLFPNPYARNQQKRWTYNAEWKCWAQACRDAGVEHVRPNWGGRHGFATHESKSETHLLALQRFLDHARFETTELYIKEFDADELALAMRPTAQEVPKAGTRDEKSFADAGSLVGTTGFEPVTSTV